MIGHPTRILIVPLLLLAAFVLRVHRLDFDLPEVRYVDSQKFVGEAQRMVAERSPRPAYFQYPGLYTNALAGLFAVLPSQSEKARYLIAQFFTAVMGTGLVAATYALARKICRGAGVYLAVALAAFSIVLVSYSRIPAPDVVAALFSTLALVVLVGRPGRLWSYAGIGVLIGLAAGTKQSGALVLPLAALTAVAAARAERSAGFALKATAVCFLAAAGIFLLTTPWFIVLWKDYAARFGLEMARQRYGQIGRVQNGFLDYLLSRTPTWEMPWLGTSLVSDPGIAALLLALAGIVLGFSGRAGFAAFLCASSFLLTLAVLAGPGHLKAIRFLIPLFPPLLALGGLAFERLIKATPRQLKYAVAALGFCAALAQPAIGSWRYVERLGRRSTNAEARDWVRLHLKPQAPVLLGPFFTDDLQAELPNFFTLPDVGARQYNYPASGGDSPERRPIYSAAVIDMCRRTSIEYVVLNSYFDGAFSRCPENARYFPESVRNYEEFIAMLNRETETVYAVDGLPAGRFGPAIRIYRFKSPPR